jgi:hypothetical protein
MTVLSVKYRKQSILLDSYLLIRLVALKTVFIHNDSFLTADLAYWWEHSPTTQEVAGTIPAQCKHLCA